MLYGAGFLHKVPDVDPIQLQVLFLDLLLKLRTLPLECPEFLSQFLQLRTLTDMSPFILTHTASPHNAPIADDLAIDGHTTDPPLLSHDLAGRGHIVHHQGIIEKDLVELAIFLLGMHEGACPTDYARFDPQRTMVHQLWQAVEANERCLPPLVLFQIVDSRVGMFRRLDDDVPVGLPEGGFDGNSVA